MPESLQPVAESALPGAHPAALLHELAAALTVAATPEQVTDAVVTKAVQLFGAAGGVVASSTANAAHVVRRRRPRHD